MNNWRRSPQALLLIIGIALGIAVLPSLSACTSGETTLARVIGAIGSDPSQFSAESDRELGRFQTVYRSVAKDPSNPGPLAHFNDAFKRVRANYVREVADAELISAAIKGVDELKATPRTIQSEKVVEAALHSMVSSLDPHSAYLNPEEFRETFISTKGEFGGIGIEVSSHEGVVKVMAPIEDTPAARAGIKAGDLITHVDGEPIKGKGLMHAVNRMRGAPGSDIRLTVARGNQPSFDVTLTRAIIKVRSVKWSTEGDIGYIRIVRFTEKVDENLEKAMKEIRNRLGSRLRGIVLDLRNNPGGLLDQSVALADAFLESGTIVSVKGRRGPGRSFDAEPGDVARGLPMVVLINAGSASASEIVASALQYHRRATVMGTRSFGKGSVQTITPLPSEGALRLTTALYYAPDGHTIQARGVDPNIVLATEPGSDGATDEAAPLRKRESDLPGALPAVGDNGNGPSLLHTVPEKACPEAGEKQDRGLGCALAFLNAGSTAKFLAALGSRRAM
jgi:carboxyl-terminal processing protease